MLHVPGRYIPTASAGEPDRETGSGSRGADDEAAKIAALPAGANYRVDGFWPGEVPGSPGPNVITLNGRTLVPAGRSVKVLCGMSTS